MPCVFPILSLKALSLARAGETEGAARREALAYAAGVILTCLALGGLLLALRAGGRGGRLGVPAPGSARHPAAAAAGHRDLAEPRRPVPAAVAGRRRRPGTKRRRARRLLHRRARRLRRHALHRPVPRLRARRGPGPADLGGAGGVRRPRARPRSALPAARLRPRPAAAPAQARPVDGALPAHPGRADVPRPPSGLAWVLGRQSGVDGMALGLGAALLLGLGLWWLGRRQGDGRVWLPLAFIVLAVVAPLPFVRTVEATPPAHGSGLAAEPFSETRLARLRADGTPVFLYFTADWCLTCKVNERAALDQAEVADCLPRARHPCHGRRLDPRRRRDRPLPRAPRPLRRAPVPLLRARARRRDPAADPHCRPADRPALTGRLKEKRHADRQRHLSAPGRRDLRFRLLRAHPSAAGRVALGRSAA